MEEITVKIPSYNYQAFLDVAKELGVEIVANAISEESKAIVRDRILKSENDPSRLVNWEEAKSNIKV